MTKDKGVEFRPTRETMGSMIDGDDGLPAEDVGSWAKEKHEYLRRYLDISRGARRKWLGPDSLGALDFRIIQALAPLKHIDMLIHVSKMDLQRNLGTNLSAEESAFDSFAPGWRGRIDLTRRQQEIRRLVVEDWRTLVAGLGIWPSTDMKLITGAGNQHLYWLLLAAKHDLAHKFWKVASDRGNPSGPRGQVWPEPRPSEQGVGQTDKTGNENRDDVSQVVGGSRRRGKCRGRWRTPPDRRPASARARVAAYANYAIAADCRDFGSANTLIMMW